MRHPLCGAVSLGRDFVGPLMEGLNGVGVPTFVRPYDYIHRVYYRHLGDRGLTVANEDVYVLVPYEVL